MPHIYSTKKSHMTKRHVTRQVIKGDSALTSCILSQQLLHVYFHSNYFMYTFTATTSCILSQQLLHVYFHSNYFMYTFTATTSCILSQQLLHVYFHSNYFMYTFTATTSCILSQQLLHVYFHLIQALLSTIQHYTFRSTIYLFYSNLT